MQAGWSCVRLDRVATLVLLTEIVQMWLNTLSSKCPVGPAQDDRDLGGSHVRRLIYASGSNKVFNSSRASSTARTGSWKSIARTFLYFEKAFGGREFILWSCQQYGRAQ
jgi:hypothetical protein